ncbi:MAG TPA: cytochrome c biogenesis protein CcdA, partial [Deinococcales bacterium]|nr:cytochrome c biogenesis protein CcdA [Deinococcales bacterium]
MTPRPSRPGRRARLALALLALLAAGQALAAPEPAAGPGVALAFAAGLASFLSPCVLPLLPSFISALSVNGRPVRGALSFSLGFSLVVMAFGASASALGSLLAGYRPLLATAGGALILAFGLVL